MFMSKPKIYIDGKEGTTGLQIYDRLTGREDIRLLLIDEDKRKDTAERKKLMDEADLVFLCLPDEAAVEAIKLVENPNTRIIDASTAHRTAPGWVYGFPELGQEQRDAIQTAKWVANPGCYATGFISLIAPLVKRGLLSPDAFLACHALSGYTGGGKKAIAQYEGAERERELVSPRHYAVTLSHKHIPEMTKVCGLTRKPIFMPMICDFPQGMVVTVPLYLDMLHGGQTLDTGITMPAPVSSPSGRTMRPSAGSSAPTTWREPTTCRFLSAGTRNRSCSPPVWTTWARAPAARRYKI